MRAVVLGLSLLVVGRASAATRTWSGAGADDNWMTAGNWDVLPVAGDDLVFPAGTSNNNFPAGTKFRSITYTSSAIMVTGNAITLGTGGIVSSDTANDHGQFALPIALAQNTTFTQNGMSEIAFNGVISGPYSLTKTGTGFFVPAAKNSYSGGTFCQAGSTFVIGTLGAVSVSGGNFALFGATLGALTATGGLVDMQNQTATAASLALSAGSTFNTDPSDGGLLHVTGSVSLGNATYDGGAGTTLVSPAFYVVIDNQGTQPVVGTFTGLPEGAAVAGVEGGSTTYISYKGGDGNDVVLFTGTATSTALTASVNPAADGESVKLTATVTSTTQPTGNVVFYDGATMLSTGSLAAGVATFTTSALAPGAHELSARYAGTSTFGVSAGALSLRVSTSSDLSGPPDLSMPVNDLSSETGDGGSDDLAVLEPDLSVSGVGADMATSVTSKHHSGCSMAPGAAQNETALGAFVLLCAFFYRRRRVTR